MEKSASAPVASEERSRLSGETPNENLSKRKIFWKKIKKLSDLDRAGMKQTCLKIAAVSLHITVSLGLISSLPNYAQKSYQSGGSTYSSLFVLSFVVALTLLALSLLRRIWDASFEFRANLRLRTLAQYAALQSLGGLLIFQSQDRHRTPCHFQDSMFLICLPVAFIINFLRSKKDYVCWTKKVLIGYGIFMAALFLGSNLQLSNRFNCRGIDWRDPTESFGGWSWESNILWTLIRGVGLCLWTFGFSLTLIYCNQWKENDRCLEIFTWVSVFSFCVIGSCCWVDTFTSLGKGSTWWEFSAIFAQGFQCHFSTVEECSRVSLVFSAFLSFLLLFLLSSILLAKHFKFSPALIISCACLAVPLTSVWWSIFALGPEGLRYQPQLSANCIAGILTFPVACASFAYCLGKYQNFSEVIDTEEKSPAV